MTKKQTFESSLLELESILQQLESDSLSLNDMLDLYERGIKLSKFCKDKLMIVENKVTTLVKKNDKLIEKEDIV